MELSRLQLFLRLGCAPHHIEEKAGFPPGLCWCSYVCAVQWWSTRCTVHTLIFCSSPFICYFVLVIQFCFKLIRCSKSEILRDNILTGGGRNKVPTEKSQLKDYSLPSHYICDPLAVFTLYFLHAFLTVLRACLHSKCHVKVFFLSS